MLLFIFFNFLDAFINFEYSIFIVNVINATFWHIFVSNKLVLHLLEQWQNISWQLCQGLAQWGALQRYLSIS